MQCLPAKWHLIRVKENGEDKWNDHKSEFLQMKCKMQKDSSLNITENVNETGTINKIGAYSADPEKLYVLSHFKLRRDVSVL